MHTQCCPSTYNLQANSPLFFLKPVRICFRRVQYPIFSRDAWTTSKGAEAFFAPRANIKLGIGGSYELFFDLDAPEGSRGSEGMKILSFLPMEMLSFDWNAPPQYPTVRRGQHTWVVVQFHPIGSNKTR